MIVSSGSTEWADKLNWHYKNINYLCIYSHTGMVRGNMKWVIPEPLGKIQFDSTFQHIHNSFSMQSSFIRIKLYQMKWYAITFFTITGRRETQTSGYNHKMTKFTWFWDHITDVARTILTVLEVYSCFAGALNRYGKGTGSCLTSPNIEFTGLALFTSFKTWATGMYTMCTSIFKWANSELEWWPCK